MCHYLFCPGGRKEVHRTLEAQLTSNSLEGVGFRAAGLPAACAGSSGDAAFMSHHSCCGGFFFSNTAAFDSPMQLQNQPINQTSVSNPRKPAGSLTINSFFGLWMAPHLGLIETCSHRPRKCHTMLLLILLQGELSRGLMSSSRLTLCPPGAGKVGRREHTDRDMVRLCCRQL